MLFSVWFSFTAVTLVCGWTEICIMEEVNGVKPLIMACCPAMSNSAFTALKCGHSLELCLIHLLKRLLTSFAIKQRLGALFHKWWFLYQTWKTCFTSLICRWLHRLTLKVGNTGLWSFTKGRWTRDFYLCVRQVFDLSVMYKNISDEP